MEEEHKEALEIVHTLRQNGYQAYFAGGWVRDHLLGEDSEDIDIATNCPVDRLLTLFPKTVPIGVQFGIVLVLIQGKEFEVATFRSDVSYEDGRRPTSVVFTNAKEDALRRDFTINGMFYDPVEKKVIDYVEGKKDLEKKVLRAIGNADLRIREDRLRMIRAIRFSCKFSLTIEPLTKKAILDHAKELFPSVAMERIVQELRKMLSHPTRKKALISLFSLGLLQEIFPALSKISQGSFEKDLEKISFYPENLPLFAYLHTFLKDPFIEDVCQYLKLSNEEKRFGEFWIKSYKLFEKEAVDDHTWAHFYAEKHSSICLKTAALKKGPSFLKDHEKRKRKLQVFIKRIQSKKPILSSSYLLQKGVKPGELFGEMLKLAEKISINEKIEDPDLLYKKIFSDL